MQTDPMRERVGLDGEVHGPASEVGAGGEDPAAGVPPGQRRLLEIVQLVLASPAAAKLVESYSRRFDAEPEKERREYELRLNAQRLNAKHDAASRVCFLIGLTVCLGFLLGIVLALRERPETLLPVLTAAVGLVAGAGVGFMLGQGKRMI